MKPQDAQSAGAGHQKVNKSSAQMQTPGSGCTLQQVFKLHGPQDPGAMYPHFIREQRTKLEILSRKRMGEPSPLHTPSSPRHCSPLSYQHRSAPKICQLPAAQDRNAKVQRCCCFTKHGRLRAQGMGKRDDTPGPATYNVDAAYKALLPSSRSFTIQGIRRPKNHENGPFATL